MRNERAGNMPGERRERSRRSGVLGERQQLQTAMMARQQMFAAGKGNLGRTDIVQHQIHMADHPPIKQWVRQYPAARREEERKLVEDMLEEGRNDAVLYQLPTNKPSHQGRSLPAPRWGVHNAFVASIWLADTGRWKWAPRTAM